MERCLPGLPILGTQEENGWRAAFRLWCEWSHKCNTGMLQSLDVETRCFKWCLNQVLLSDSSFKKSVWFKDLQPTKILWMKRFHCAPSWILLWIHSALEQAMGPQLDISSSVVSFSRSALDHWDLYYVSIVVPHGIDFYHVNNLVHRQKPFLHLAYWKWYVWPQENEQGKIFFNK